MVVLPGGGFVSGGCPGSYRGVGRYEADSRYGARGETENAQWPYRAGLRADGLSRQLVCGMVSAAAGRSTLEELAGDADSQS